jgi:O-antigen ligase
MKPSTSTRPVVVPSTSFILVIVAAIASVSVGAGVTRSPSMTLVLLVGCVLLAVAVTRPAVLFAVCTILLAVEPTRIFGADTIVGKPETYKLALFALILPIVLSRGVARKKCAPLAAYIVVTILAAWLGTPLVGLTASQTAASLITLCIGWLVFAVNWDWRRDHRLLEVLAWTPVLSVAVGVVLQTLGIYSLFGGASTPRLEGATVAAWLGTFSLCAVVACSVLYRREQWKWAKWLGLADVSILGGTLTRGAVLALCVVAVPWVIRFARRQLVAKGTNGLVQLGLAVVVVIIGAALLIPGLRERDESATSHTAGGSGVHDESSGRLRAWAFAYEQAKVNLVFGRGLGAGPIVGRSPGSPAGFTAQHNEYVRMLLEVGIVGGVILLTAMLATMISLIRNTPRLVRADLAAAAAAFAIYAITENTLSATPISVAMLLLFGVAGSGARPLSSKRASV